jgi:hypothetical protein
MGLGWWGLGRHKVVQFLEERAEKGDEGGQFNVTGLGRDDTVDFQKERFGLRDMREFQSGLKILIVFGLKILIVLG